MLGQCDHHSVINSAPVYEKELQERWKRSVWEDLIFAIQLLKKFDEEINKLHPDIKRLTRRLMD